MENPATWSKATWIIHAAIQAHREMEEAECIGLSLPALIVVALAEEGYLTEEALQRKPPPPEPEGSDLKPEEAPDFKY